MRNLRPFQEQAVEWFWQLPSRRGTIVLPPGTGKTTVALAIAERTAEPGPGLVVAPAATAVQWIDRAEDFGLAASILNHRTMPDLIKTRNEVAHGRGTDRLHLWIASDRYLRDPKVAPSIGLMEWSIVIVDEAHRYGDEAVGVESAKSVLYLTATPRPDPTWPAGSLPTYIPQDIVGMKSTLQEVTFSVEPTPPELHFLRLVDEWQSRGQSSADQFVRSVVAGQCRAGVLPGIDAIERHLAGVSSPDGDREPIDANPAERKTLLDILEVGYKVELPDSRSRRVISEVRRLGGRVVVVSSTVSHLHYLADLLQRDGVFAVIATSAMDRSERRAALVSDATPPAPLLLSDASSSSWAMSNRDVLIHGDLPSKSRQRERVASFLESDPMPRELDVYVIEWAIETPKLVDEAATRRSREH